MILMSDILTAVLGFSVGIPFGYWLRRPRNPISPNGCTCGHPRGFHRDGNGPCRHDVPTNIITRLSEGGPNTCGCQVYDGPQRPEDIIRGFQP